MLRRSTISLFLALLFVGNETRIANGGFFDELEKELPTKHPTLKHVTGKPFLVEVVQYERTRQRSWWGEVLMAFTAPEQLYYTRKAVATLGISPDDAVKYVQLKRDLIGEVTKKKGEEEWGIWPSPLGYTLCHAEMPSKNFKYQAGSSDVTFNTRVLRTPREDGLGYYSVVPYSNEGTRVSATIMLTYVKVATSGDVEKNIARLKDPNKCMFQNTCPWMCRNDNCSLVVSNCIPSDKRPDRWLAGETKGTIEHD
jgi:hypothetical protein